MHDSAGEHASARIIMDEYHRTRAPLCGQVLAKVQSLLRRDQQRATEAASPSESTSERPQVSLAALDLPKSSALAVQELVDASKKHTLAGHHEQGVCAFICRCQTS
jgi:hypothetical protein